MIIIQGPTNKHHFFQNNEQCEQRTGRTGRTSRATNSANSSNRANSANRANTCAVDPDNNRHNINLLKYFHDEAPFHWLEVCSCKIAI